MGLKLAALVGFCCGRGGYLFHCVGNGELSVTVGGHGGPGEVAAGGIGVGVSFLDASMPNHRSAPKSKMPVIRNCGASKLCVKSTILPKKMDMIKAPL